VWWFGGYGMVVYSLVEDRGPFTFLLRWQEAAFGGSNLLLGAGSAAIVIFLGPPVVIGWLQRLWPQNALIADLRRQMTRAGRSRREIAADAAERWETTDTAQRIAMARRGRNIGLGFFVGALALGFVLSTWLRLSADADAGKPLTAVTLSRAAPIDLGKASPWVRVMNGQPRLDSVIVLDYNIRGHAYRDYYTPLLPSGWQAGDPVFLVEKDVTIPRYHDAEDSPDPAGPIEGELTPGGLRQDVARALRREGFDVGSFTAVLRRHLDLGGKIPGEAAGLDILIWLETGMFALIGLFIAIARQRRLRRLAKGAA
ncbi:hypothetical protein, partial [Acidisoma sp. C75]